MLAALLAQEIALPGCAPRVFNSIVTDNSTVIASVSEAIQSKPRMRSPSLGCFALLAMTDSVVDNHALRRARFFAGPSN